MGADAAATLERRGGVLVITLNRPAAMNAVNAELSGVVGSALEELESDPSLSVGVVTGTGRAFCAGADLKGIAAGEALHAPGHPEWGFAGLVEHPIGKPLIAAVNGFALGGGTEIALACDLTVMAESAVFGLPEVKRGLLAAAGGVIRLPRQVPVRLAMEAALTGEPIDSATAMRWGLVNRVVPDGQVLDAALELATRIAANAPIAVRASKRLVRAASGDGSPWDARVWELNTELITEVFSSKDASEGPRAFAEKRPPVWTNQ